MKTERQKIILRIISEKSIETQSQLMDELRANGITCTQATLSRDIRELSLLKKRDADGVSHYTAGDSSTTHGMSRRLQENLRQTVKSISACRNLVIIKTLPGLAPAVCAAIDGISPAGVVGSLAGNDTVFLAMRDDETASALAGENSDLLIGR